MLKLAVGTEDEKIIDYTAKRFGINTVSLDSQEEPEEGVVVLIVRSPNDSYLENTLQAIRKAATLFFPTLVIIGVADPVGKVILDEAEKYGIPKECLLFVTDEKIVDGLGNVLGDALQGTSIGITAMTAYAAEIAEKELIPELPLWSAKNITETITGAQVPAGSQAIASEESPQPEEQQHVREIAAPEEAQSEAGKPDAGHERPWDDYLKQAKKTVAVFGIKNGVETSTVAACLSGVLADHGSIYLEIADNPAGYFFFGSSVKQAGENGDYAYCSKTAVSPEVVQDIPILIADAGIPEAMDAVYSRADCVILVTDGSHEAFKKVEKWIKGDWRTDILVVDRIVPGTGYPPEVYTGEFHLEHVIGIPGGIEEETAINLAQRNGELPLGTSVDFDAAIGELAEAVLKIVND